MRRCMLNLSPDHLDRHGDMAGYAAAKRQIFARRPKRRIPPSSASMMRRAARCLQSIPGNSARISGIPAGGYLVRLMAAMLRDDARAPSSIMSPRGMRCPGRITRRMLRPLRPLALALGVSRVRERSPPASSVFPGLAHRQELVGTKSMACGSSTTARPRMPMRPRPGPDLL